MKSPQRILVEFEQRKNELCHTPHLSSKQNMEDILSWPDDTCRTIIDTLQSELEHRMEQGDFLVDQGTMFDDSNISPYCLLVRNVCHMCHFGIRNGRCSDPDSIYQKTINIPGAPYNGNEIEPVSFTMGERLSRQGNGQLLDILFQIDMI